MVHSTRTRTTQYLIVAVLIGLSTMLPESTDGYSAANPSPEQTITFARSVIHNPQALAE